MGSGQVESGASQRDGSDPKLADASGRVPETRDWRDDDITHNTDQQLHNHRLEAVHKTDKTFALKVRIVIAHNSEI